MIEKNFEFIFDNIQSYAIIPFVSVDRALVAQLDRAFGYGPKGWEFEPSLVHKSHRSSLLEAVAFLYDCML